MKAKNKIIIVCLSVCLVDILLLVLFFLPLLKNMKAASKDLAIKKNVSLALERQAAALADFSNNASDLQKYSRLVKGAFVDFSAPVDFLNFLETWARFYGLDVGIAPLDSVLSKDDVWRSSVFRVTGQGELSDCLRFVEMLENSRWVLNVVKLNLQKNDTGAADIVLEIKVFSDKK